MSTGAASAAISYIREQLAPIFAALKWELLTADSKFAAWNLLFTPGESGICVIGWNGDAPTDQAGQSLVTTLRLSITLSGRRHLQDPATARLSKAGSDSRLMEVHDRVKGAMLALTIPEGIRPNTSETTPYYRGAVPVVSPEGIPLDALEQSWEVRLIESFSPVA